ncbi:unnamed protein product [Phytomonas sp. Hart1]|nr:unnamed protein product [Phytomonas sp. Hart1]|eukprot:CCW71029.1 unnamed protein product [Phytomonas sp. isolate Hart1]
MSTRLYRLLFVGAPGVGKGTYSSRAAAALRCTSISSGDLLRSEVEKDTEIGRRVKNLIENGIFVPDALISEMVMNHFTQMHTSAEFHGYIFDGFPRNFTQAKTIWDSGDMPIDCVINFAQPNNVILAKVSSRRMCSNCGFVYNLAKIDEGGIKMDPLLPRVKGICDKCGSTGPLVTRKDDEFSVMEARLKDYEKISVPLLHFYQEKGVLHNFEVLGGAKQYLPRLLELIKSIYSCV